MRRGAIGLCFGEPLPRLAPDALGFLEFLLLIGSFHNGLRNVLLCRSRDGGDIETRSAMFRNGSPAHRRGMFWAYTFEPLLTIPHSMASSASVNT